MSRIVAKAPLPIDDKNAQSSMDSSMEAAVDLNNESAALLCSGEDGKAVARLSRSLTSMRQLIARHSRTGRQCPTPGDASARGSDLIPVIPSSLQVPALRDSDYFIYSRCMEVPSFHQRSHKHVSLYSACIVLNLALAYHRLGIKGHRCSLSKAERMYYMALQLLSGPSASSNSETALSMRVFAVNNLVQVHQEQCQYNKAQAGVKHLSALLNEAMSSGTFFHKDELRKFVLNASLWEPPQMAASA